MQVRRAQPGDAGAIGRVHVQAWQAAYRGDMPDAYLDSLSEADRAAGWARGLGRPRERDPVLIAEGDSGLLGFAAIGEAADPAGVGELFAIYVDPEHWGHGVGQALLPAVYRELLDLGFDSAVLWVLPTNERARRFYERAGWTRDGAERIADVLGISVPEIRYRTNLRLRLSPDGFDVI